LILEVSAPEDDEHDVGRKWSVPMMQMNNLVRILVNPPRADKMALRRHASPND
jgi:hypothetical protein